MRTSDSGVIWQMAAIVTIVQSIPNPPMSQCPNVLVVLGKELSPLLGAFRGRYSLGLGETWLHGSAQKHEVSIKFIPNPPRKKREKGKHLILIYNFYTKCNYYHQILSDHLIN